MKRRILSILTLLIMGSTLVGVIPAYAQSPTPVPSKPNFFQGLIQFIAQKFGLDQTQVQTAITDYQNQQKQVLQANAQQRQKSRFDQLVSQGKITQDQENLILSKLQELQNNRQNWKNLTADQRKTAMTQQKTDLQNWAKSNNIDPQYLFGFGRFGMGMGGMMGRGWAK